MNLTLKELLELDDRICPNGVGPGRYHTIESSTYVDICYRCSYQCVYPGIFKARPGILTPYETFLLGKFLQMEKNSKE